MKLPRALIFTGAIAAVLIVATVASGLLLSWLIDRQPLRQKISSELATKTGGSVVLGKIAVLWFPRPTVVVENAEISFGAAIHGSIRTVKIYPSILHLLTGQLVVRRAHLQEPRLSIHISEPSGMRFELELWEEQVRAALVRLSRESTAPRVDLSDGSAEIRIGHDPPVILLDVAAQTAGSPDKVRFELSARSNLWERLKVDGSISPENLASDLDIGVQRLKIKEFLTLLPLQISEYAQEGEGSFDMKIAFVGLRRVKASIDGTAGPLVFAGDGGTAKLEAKRLKGGITYESGVLQVNVQELVLSSPRLQASGDLKVDSGTLSARIQVRGVDIAEARQIALRIADDSGSVKRIVGYLQSGTIDELNFESAGRSVVEMASSKNIIVFGRLRGCKIFVLGAGLELEDVTGSVRLSAGILEADGVSANLGATKAWNGKLRLGLEGKAAPFHVDTLLHTSAAELHAVLLKLARDQAFRDELLKVRDVEGELSGRLVLGETLEAFSPVVAVSKANLTATYEPVPYPIAIRSGHFIYDQKIIKLESAQGAVGRSTFGGLGVTLHHDGSRQIKVHAGRVSLDLQQTEALLRSFKDLRPHFAKLQAMRGRVELQNLALAGAYDEPAGWAFASAGRFDQVEITHANFPGRMTLARGKFAANQQRIIFSDGAAAMSDAALIAGGTFEYKKGKPFQFETSGMGTIGPEMTRWLSRYIELPEALELRSPLKIAAGRLAWRTGGDISFRGQMTVAAGPLITVDAVKQPHTLALQNLTIDDRGRRARMTFQLDRDHLDWSFSGELMQQTVDELFAAFPMKGSWLEGDLRASVVLADPVRVSALGQLNGSNLVIPLGTDKALIENFSIEASGESVQVRSADLRWGKSRLALSGKVTSAKHFLQLDLDLAGDRLEWEEIQRFFAGENKQRQQKRSGVMSIPDVAGTIRLKADRVTSGRLNVSPVETTVVISPSEIRVEINRGVVCGVDTTGRVEFADKDIRLDLQLSATNALLEPATICLTNQQNDVKGTYSLTARITGSGDRDRLRSALKGDFQLSARDGEFVRAPGIDATFDYLNATGDFKVAFPDLDRETFPYRFVGVKGRIEGKMLIGDEINVQSSLLNLSGQGRVDLERQHIDGKGLIAILKPVDEVIAWIPVIRSMISGSLVGIPFRVSGSLERPDVTYLSPADVGVELLNIPLRVLGIPLGAMSLFTPSGDLQDKDVTN
jgi:AsmA-like C-terminal region